MKCTKIFLKTKSNCSKRNYCFLTFIIFEVTTQHPCLNACIVSETKKYALRNHKTVFAFFQYL